jgi:hypothetical protein
MRSVTVARRLRFRSSLVLLMIGVACGGPAAPAQTAPPAGEWREFDGNWTASGTRTTLDLGTNHTASNIHMNGSLLLTRNTLGVGFRAEVVGLVDSQSGMVGRAVWTDERGDKVFSELKGEWVGAGNRIAGTFLGGTGRYAGVTGEYEFQWQYVLAAEDGTVSGRTVGFKGRARLDAPPVPAPPAEGVLR